VRRPERHEDGEPHEILRDPHPAAQRVRPQQRRITPPAGSLSQHGTDDDAQQRPPDDDADRPGQRAGRVRDDLHQEEVLGPAGAQGDERGDADAEQPDQDRPGLVALPQPPPADQQRGDDRGAGTDPDGTTTGQPPGDEDDRGHGRVERGPPPTQQIGQRLRLRHVPPRSRLRPA
jgi:hypothetical protein